MMSQIHCKQSIRIEKSGWFKHYFPGNLRRNIWFKVSYSPVVRRLKDCLFLAVKRSKRKTLDRKKTVAPFNYNRLATFIPSLDGLFQGSFV